MLLLKQWWCPSVVLKLNYFRPVMERHFYFVLGVNSLRTTGRKGSMLSSGLVTTFKFNLFLWNAFEIMWQHLHFDSGGQVNCLLIFTTNVICTVSVFQWNLDNHCGLLLEIQLPRVWSSQLCSNLIKVSFFLNKLSQLELIIKFNRQMYNSCIYILQLRYKLLLLLFKSRIQY